MELDLQPTGPTVETFWRSRHFSVSDYTAIALARGARDDKPVKTPFAATEDMIAAAEARLGLPLPDTLRALYRRQNGGGLPTYFAPLKDDPRSDEDWTGAFADDYNDIRPLSALESLAENYEEYKEEDDPPVDAWLPGAERMVILTQRYEDVTLLDYREGDAPKVLLADIDVAAGLRPRAAFASFDAFFDALRAEKQDDRAIRLAFDAARLGDQASGDQFWGWSGWVDHGADDRAIETAETRLGVRLPMGLEVVYRARNGGLTPYRYAPSSAGLSPEAAEAPDRDLAAMPGRFSPIEQFVDLRTLSDRLAFQPPERPWAALWRAPERLVVLAGSYEQALMLDYRGDPASPSVLFARNLDQGEAGETVRFGDFDAYRRSLRALRWGDFDAAVLTDPRISSRFPAAERFWAEANRAAPAAEAAISAAEARLGLTLPTLLQAAYQIHDGGEVAFGHLPRQRPTPSGVSLPPYSLPVKEGGRWLRVLDVLPRLEALETAAAFLRRRPAWAADRLWQSTPPERCLVLADGVDAGSGLTLLDYGANPRNGDHNHLLVATPDEPRGALRVVIKVWRPFQSLRALRAAFSP